MNVQCMRCRGDIESERIAILPDTLLCMVCAKIVQPPRLKGRMCFSEKTSPSICIMSNETFTKTTKYYVPNGARSVMKNFSKHVCA
jgi:hypothetical protein